MDNFIEKKFSHCPGGYYDENNFYLTLNGSFWDPDGVYFNRYGVDKHGGYYDSHLYYHPGKGWIHDLLCYEDEKQENKLKDNWNLKNEEHCEDGDDILDELFENIDYTKQMINFNENNNTQIIFKPKKDNDAHCENNAFNMNNGRNILDELFDDTLPIKESKEKNVQKHSEQIINVDSLFD